MFILLDVFFFEEVKMKYITKIRNESPRIRSVESEILKQIQS